MDNNKTMKIACCSVIVISGLIILLGIIGAAVYLFLTPSGASLIEQLQAEFTGASSTPNQPAAVAVPLADGDSPNVLGNLSTVAGGAVAVGLAWDEAVDCDLQILDASGTTLLCSAWNIWGNDVQDGQGMEYFLFTNSAGNTYGSGDYVVNVYYAGQGNTSLANLVVTLKVIKADGSEITRQKRINWEPGRDNWRAFRINATTGDIVDIDQIGGSVGQPNPNAMNSATTTGTPLRSLHDLPTVANGMTAVGLSWNDPVDCDLQIRDASGTHQLCNAWQLHGVDVRDGTQGPEYFVFDNDYQGGEYVVSAYFAGQGGTQNNNVAVTLRVLTPDGSSIDRQKLVSFDTERDEWLAFRVNAATGRITDIDTLQ